MLTFAALVLARAHFCLTLNEVQSKCLYLLAEFNSHIQILLDRCQSNQPD